MRINLAHVRERAAAGGWIDVAVFDARSTSGSHGDNAGLLAQLTRRARTSGLKVDQSALAFMQNGRLTFYGSPHLVDYLTTAGLPRWTHQIDL